MDPYFEQERLPTKTALAVSDNQNGLGSSIFYEIFAEFGDLQTGGNTIDYTAAHEIGHLFNGEHLDGGLMGVDATIAFSPITLDKIRRIAHP
jgi:hypothetical protein